MNSLSPNARKLIALGAINAFLAVALGAFGAHGLQELLTPKALQTWHTGVDYHGFHALGLILIGLLSTAIPTAIKAGWWLLGGTLLFSGSLYLLALSDIKMVGIITPIGGICFLIGWLLLAQQALHATSDNASSDNHPEETLEN